jgi:hypothetical protein
VLVLEHHRSAPFACKRVFNSTIFPHFLFLIANLTIIIIISGGKLLDASELVQWIPCYLLVANDIKTIMRLFPSDATESDSCPFLDLAFFPQLAVG